MNVDSFTHDDWAKIWDGGWSFLSCTHFGDEYTKDIIFGGKPFQTQSIMFASKGRSSGWMRQSDRDTLGAYLSAEVKDNASVETIARRLSFQAQDFLAYIAKHENTVTTKELYDDFWQRLCIYYKEHINVKYVVDYLKPELLEKYLPIFQKARLEAEPVLNRSEDFIQSFAKILSGETKYDSELLLCLTKFEIGNYFSAGTLPKKSELALRYERTAFLHDKKSALVIVGDAVKQVEDLVHKTEENAVKGVVAFRGNIKGVVRIVHAPDKVEIFNTGDILVAGATRPEFLPLMKKAGAFITDAGGLLSHAAITARELKKPCIIGTKIATKVLKDGDMVEVDAERGIVTILERSPEQS